MEQALFSKAVDAYSKFQTLTDTDAAKQKVIQSVALIVVANAAYNASRTRLTQATISMSGATVLWMNQEAFLHKALSENVASFSVENNRLSKLITKFERIGIDIESLSESQRDQLQKQMTKSQELFKTFAGEMKEQTESAQASHRELRKSVDASTHRLTQAQNTLALVFEQVIQTYRSVTSEEELAVLSSQVETLNTLAKKALQTPT